MQEYKLFVQRIGLLGIINIITYLSSFILLPILTNYLNIVDYGIWVQFNVTIGLLISFAALGLPYTMVRFLAAQKNQKKIQEGFYSILLVVLSFNVIILILLYYLSNEIAYGLFDNNIYVSLILPLAVFLSCLNTLLINYFRTFQQMKRYSFFLLLQTYVNVFLVAYFVISGKGISGAVTGYLITQFVLSLVMFILIISNIGFKIPKFKNIREYLSFGLPSIPGNLSNWIIDSSDRYIIGLLLGASFVGYYNPGYTLGNILFFFIMPFNILLPTVLTNYYDNGNLSSVKKHLEYAQKYYLFFSIPAVFGLSILSKPLLEILTTEQIASTGYLVTPFVAISMLLFGLSSIISQIMVLNKNTKTNATIGIFAALINVILNILLIPFFGIIGAAAVTLMAYLIMFILKTHYSFKYFTFNIDKKFIGKSILASVLMSIVIIFANPNGVLEILITVFLCSIVYIILIIILRGFEKEEINFIKHILHQK